MYARAMSHVVMQAAEFASPDSARRAEIELGAVMASYARFEATDANPWGGEGAPPPLVAFGRAHGIEWPADKSARFFLKGLFEEEARLLRVDRMLFFWGGGFDLGGETLREILRKLGAVRCTDGCDLVVRVADPDARAAELAAFLTNEDYEDQFELSATEPDLEHRLFSLTLEGESGARYLIFDDSGVQDWAFVAILPQLDGEDPRLRTDLD